MAARTNKPHIMGALVVIGKMAILAGGRMDTDKSRAVEALNWRKERPKWVKIESLPVKWSGTKKKLKNCTVLYFKKPIIFLHLSALSIKRFLP